MASTHPANGACRGRLIKRENHACQEKESTEQEEDSKVFSSEIGRQGLFR